MQRGIGQMLVGSILVTAARRYRDRLAVNCSETGRRLTFGQLNERANRLAHALLSLGLKKGDTLAFLSTNRVELVELFFALAKTGIVGMPLNYRLACGEILDLMRTVHARALVAQSQFSEVLARAPAEVPTLERCVVIDATPGESADGAGSVPEYEAMLAGAPAHEPEADLHEDDPFYFNLTSGTSGLPKCYALSQYNNATLIPMFLAMDLGPRDVVLTTFPMFGRVGFAWTAGAMLFGIPNVIANFEAGRVLELIEQEGVTITNLVPTMGALLLAHPDLPKRRLSSLRATVFAGSMLPEPIRRGVSERICPRLYEYYGMQETGTLVLSTPEDRQHRSDSVGRPVLFAEVRIVDDHGRTLPAGAIGEIVGRSPNGVTAYHLNPDKSAETFRDGWVHTGDLGSMDDEGYLFIRGRKKDMIVSGGQNVFAAEVEEAILTLPGVVECAVIGLPDPLWGERVTAVAVVAATSPLGSDDVIRHCRERLAGFKTPKQVMLQTDPLPRTPTGKVQKFILVDRHR